jgi:hypothetical protein
MKFAKYTFFIAGVYGLLVLVPQYFVELGLWTESPPVIAQPGFYYGFIGVAVAFQFVFLIIGSDPVKYRLMMLPSMIEKFSFAAAAVALKLNGRLDDGLFYGALIDLLLGLLFIVSFLKTRPR